MYFLLADTTQSHGSPSGKKLSDAVLLTDVVSLFYLFVQGLQKDGVQALVVRVRRGGQEHAHEGPAQEAADVHPRAHHRRYIQVGGRGQGVGCGWVYLVPVTISMS